MHITGLILHFISFSSDPLAVKKSCLTPTRGVFSLRSFSFCQNYHCPWQIDTSSVAMWIQQITLPHPEAQGLWRLPSAKTVYDRYCLPVLDYPSRCGLCAPKCICRFFLMARSMELYSLINTVRALPFRCNLHFPQVICDALHIDFSSVHQLFDSSE